MWNCCSGMDVWGTWIFPFFLANHTSLLKQHAFKRGEKSWSWIWALKLHAHLVSNSLSVLASCWELNRGQFSNWCSWTSKIPEHKALLKHIPEVGKQKQANEIRNNSSTKIYKLSHMKAYIHLLNATVIHLLKPNISVLFFGTLFLCSKQTSLSEPEYMRPLRTRSHFLKILRKYVDIHILLS